MAMYQKEASFDVVVIGGGFSGVCAAIAAAREGVRVALIQNRPVFGGTGSSETRMHIVGANCHSSKPNLRETGIIEEILLENKRRNPYANFPIFDMIVWEKVTMEPNITSYLNTNIDDVIMDGGKILAVVGHQNTTETKLTIRGKIFIDATGHGTVGVMAGAASRIGSESKYEFNEPTAPEEANTDTMGNTIMFAATDRGEPVEFIKPVWANTYTEEDLKNRPHVDHVCSHSDGGVMAEFDNSKNRLPEFSNVDAGYWWIELGGDADDIIAQSEQIRDDLLKVLYGVWDHIKNQGDHGADNLDLEWVSMVPGYRESRRLEGDYLLNENDIRANRVFDDAVAYGAWPMDVHVPGGAKSLDITPSKVYNFEGHYSIPYRCFYSRNVENLMMAGRDISASKMAFSSLRVMGTCAVGGQAAGTAAAIAVQQDCTPRQVGQRHIRQLQQKLLKNDCYIPGHSNLDEHDLARSAKITVSSQLPGGEGENVVNGVSRSVDDSSNCWISEALTAPQSICLTLQKAAPVKEVRMTFDTDLSHEIQPSLIKNVRKRQVKYLPLELVKAYRVELLRDGCVVAAKEVEHNHQRLNVLKFDAVACDAVKVTILETHGCDNARIFEIRIY
ncbi:MAG: FAD-dependent oxidoreductase [Ruminococcaceae bacterium]|nr:FAD-dependent oxidoreductase [Oscillospiraceae bacterium]